MPSRQDFGSSLIESILGGLGSAMADNHALKKEDMLYSRQNDRNTKRMLADRMLKQQWSNEDYQTQRQRQVEQHKAGVQMKKDDMAAAGLTPEETAKALRKMYVGDESHFSPAFMTPFMTGDLEGAAKAAKTDKEISALIDAKRFKDQTNKPVTRFNTRTGQFEQLTSDGAVTTFGEPGAYSGGSGGSGSSGSAGSASQQRLSRNDQIGAAKKLRDMLKTQLDTANSAFEQDSAAKTEKARKSLWFNGWAGGPKVDIQKPAELVGLENDYQNVDKSYQKMLRESALGTSESSAAQKPTGKSVSPGVQKFLEGLAKISGRKK